MKVEMKSFFEAAGMDTENSKFQKIVEALGISVYLVDVSNDSPQTELKVASVTQFDVRKALVQWCMNQEEDQSFTDDPDYEYEVRHKCDANLGRVGLVGEEFRAVAPSLIYQLSINGKLMFVSTEQLSEAQLDSLYTKLNPQ